MPDFNEMRRPFNDDEVQWRVDSVMKWQSGPHVRLLAYIDARAAMERLDRACTPAGWSDAYAPGPGGGVACTLSVKVADEWISKTDVAENTQIEAVKGGVSDAFKRACVKWGLGRNLYAIGDTVCPVLDRKPDVRAVRVYSKREGIKGWAQAPHIEAGEAVPLPAVVSAPPPRPAPRQAPQPANGAAPVATADDLDATIPVCPLCKGPGALNHDKRTDRSPDYLCPHGCKREGTEYDLGYWAASEKQRRMAFAVIGKYAAAADLSKESALADIAAALDVPGSVSEWSQPMCSAVIDFVDGANRSGQVVGKVEPGPDDVPSKVPPPEPELEDDIPF